MSRRERCAMLFGAIWGFMFGAMLMSSFWSWLVRPAYGEPIPNPTPACSREQCMLIMRPHAAAESGTTHDPDLGACCLRLGQRIIDGTDGNPNR